MTAKEWSDPATDVPALYGDSEASAASGVPLPSLRVLQAAGAIRSWKSPKPHGGFRRMWPQEDVLKASIAAAMSEHFAWNIRIVSEALAKAPGGVWDALVALTIDGLEAHGTRTATLIKSSELDWHLELVDRKYLFLNVPEFVSAVLPDACSGTSENGMANDGRIDLLLGIARKDGFTSIPWAFRTRQGRATMKATLGQNGYQKMERVYRAAMASHRHFLSKATVNANMQVRMTAYRLRGREAHFVQKLIHLRNGETEP